MEMKKKQRKGKKVNQFRVFGAMSLVAFVAVLLFLMMGLGSTIGGIKEESISKSADVILANAGLNDDKDVFLSVMYYDQKQDECVGLYDISREDELKKRQFGWSECGYYNNDIEKDLVDYELGNDHFPTFLAGKLIPNRGLDEADRWYQAVENKSASYFGTLGLKYEAEKAEFYFNRDEFYPIDEVKFSEGDVANQDGHNHLFTMSFAVPFTVLANGSEEFEITADDDTFVFVGDRLAIDLGGVHDAMTGSFSINEDGEVYAASGDEEQAYTGITLKGGDGAMVRIFHADRDSSSSVFGVKFTGMNISVVDSRLASQNGGVQIAYDPTDPTYEAPLGQSVVMKPDNSKGLMIMAMIEGVMVVVFAVLIVIAARIAIRRRMQ